LEEEDVVANLNFSSGIVNYDAVAVSKIQLYQKAFDRFLSNSTEYKSLRKKFDEFVFKNSYWLEDYALFVAIKDRFNGKIWTSWPEALRKRKKKELEHFKQSHALQIHKTKFLQFLFFIQWKALRDCCQKQGVCLIGDMAIYVSWDSADVWAHPQNFKLDERFHPTGVAGVPPDYFSDTGQRWGNPVYDWESLEDAHFSWWVERFRHSFRLFDTVRIDHFRGLVQYWEIPANEQSAVIGKWEDVPTDHFFKALEKEFPKRFPIIAEDLGFITDDVREAMHRLGFPGMKVLLFAFNGDLKGHPYLPHNYKERCVVYTGTHDNNTVLGWYMDEATPNELVQVQKYLGKKISEQNICYDLIHLAFDSIAELAIIPLQDICELGGEARMNKPGTIQGNWQWRAEAGMFSDVVVQKLLKVTVVTKRD
jgi:4-alpha-glucanotransferase